MGENPAPDDQIDHYRSNGSMATHWEHETALMFRESVMEFAVIAKDYPPSTGLLVSLSGASMWFLAVLAETYLAGPILPWEGISPLLASLITVTLGWYATPGLTVLGVIGSLGLGAVVAGVVLALNAARPDTVVHLRIKRLFE